MENPQDQHETTDAPVTEGATASQGGPTPADTRTPAADQSRAVAVVERQRLIATSDVALWDSAAFEHMNRVGVVMAQSGLMSPTFSDGVDPKGLVARCVMVANLAREVGANPLMLLQTCSIISNKLHLEGKAVAAIIASRTGVKLAHRFGVWNEQTGRLNFPPLIQAEDLQGQPQTNHAGEPVMIADPAFFDGCGDLLGVRTFDPADPERYVEGYVRAWRTTRKNNPWENPANWRRQLRYRGAPEWARAYEPGAVLGFYSEADGLGADNEFMDTDAVDVTTDSPSPRGGKKRALRDKAQGKGQEGDQGFDRAHVASETAQATQAASQGSGAAEETPHNPETGEVIEPTAPREGEEGHTPAAEDEVMDAEFTEVGEGEGEPTGEATTPAADAEPGFTHDMEDDEDDIPEAMLAQAASLARMSPLDEEEDAILERLIAADEAGETITAGHAEVGEQYLIAGEVPGEDGRRLTYKDGERFSGKKDISGLKFYAIHAPLKVEEEQPETPAAPEPEAPAAEETQPQDDTFLGRMARMSSWLQIKAAVAELNKTTDWMGASPTDQDELRRHIWEQVLRVKKDHKDPVDHALDVTAFGLWIATQKGRDGADAVEGTFNVLKASEAWGKLKPAQHEVLEARVAAKLKSLRG